MGILFIVAGVLASAALGAALARRQTIGEYIAILAERESELCHLKSAARRVLNAPAHRCGQALDELRLALDGRPHALGRIDMV